ncbi:TIGR03016 family PEP-CTERM system-associated outer membrane protein [Geomonas oryzae]|uniref:TIGR03016 family PEP-CTERM system-associated outer membrane protein n=1 Tax=Geomonas oryzae TaxID=2364273 RepID=UPI00100BF22D|nr:TIGR03016 family PEP-CTERM system-associated outer membrane protein [Geomonas oryzae]
MSVPVRTMRTAAVFSAVLLTAFSPALAAEFRLVPSLTLGEEYNDNLLQTASRQKTDFVTRVQPGVAFSAEGGGFSTDVTYGLDYRYFANGTRRDQFDHRAGMKGSFRFFDDFLHLDLSDSYSRVSTDVARDVVNESLVVDQLLQNNAVISPYLNWRLPGAATLKTGYRYRDTRYWSGDGLDKIEHDGYAEYSRELTAGFTLSAAYNFAHLSSEASALDRHEGYLGLRYDWSTATFIYGKFGYDWQSFDSGANTSDPFWDVGASRDFGILTATAGTKVQYTEDPQTLSTRNVRHYATLSRVFSRGFASLGGSYEKFEKQQLIRDVEHKTLIEASARYLLRPDLTLMLGLAGDRLSNGGTVTYPYHLTGSFGMDYMLSEHLVLGANYTHISYRHHLDSAGGAVEVNRAIVEMRLSL